jgi:DNA mismatch endonuclease, patch repair protein
LYQINIIVLKMADVLTQEQRKLNMSSIKGKNTSPELKLRKLIYSKGVRGYRVHPNIPGKPDVIFTKYKLAIFVDGCFWHKCPVHFKEPDTRKEFWLEKINQNVERDQIVNLKLKEAGWIVLRIWEHQIRENPDVVVTEIIDKLK